MIAIPSVVCEIRNIQIDARWAIRSTKAHSLLPIKKLPLLLISPNDYQMQHLANAQFVSQIQLSTETKLIVVLIFEHFGSVIKLYIFPLLPSLDSPRLMEIQ